MNETPLFGPLMVSIVSFVLVAVSLWLRFQILKDWNSVNENKRQESVDAANALLDNWSDKDQNFPAYIVSHSKADNNEFHTYMQPLHLTSTHIYCLGLHYLVHGCCTTDTTALLVLTCMVGILSLRSFIILT